MERYESLGQIGEGSYGIVMKCRHRDSGRLVAIKKFLDSDDDRMVKKIALREIKLLRQLRHDNLVNLLEVWKRRHRWYLVFEFVDHTLLDELDQNSSGLGLNTSRQYLFQILRAAEFCHQQNVIHRDIKPENVLISHSGVVKLCDFGFARTVTSSLEGAVYTDYVATRWYRAPELLVGDTKYGKPVDVWALGCLLIEMLTGQALFPGDSDLDQLYHIVKCFGRLFRHHQELFLKNSVFTGIRLPECSTAVSLAQRFPSIPANALNLVQKCLEMDPGKRARCSDLLKHGLFTHDSFHIRYTEELNGQIQKEHRQNSTFPKIAKPMRREQGQEKARKGKNKRQGEDAERKVNKEKTDSKAKGKQTAKLGKAVRNASAKQTKPQSNKGIQNGVSSTVTAKTKQVKVTESQKDSGVSKLSKPSTSESADQARTTASLKDKNQTAKADPKTDVSSEPTAKANPKNLSVKADPKAAAPSEPRRGNLKSVRETIFGGSKWESKTQNMLKIRRLSKSQPSQEFGRSTDAAKGSSGRSTDVQGGSTLSSKAASESAVNRVDARPEPELSGLSKEDQVEASPLKVSPVYKSCKPPICPKTRGTADRPLSSKRKDANGNDSVSSESLGASAEPSADKGLPNGIANLKVCGASSNSSAPLKTSKPRLGKENGDNSGLPRTSLLTETFERSASGSPSTNGDPESSEIFYVPASRGKVSDEDRKTPSEADRNTPRESVGSAAVPRSDATAKVSPNSGDNENNRTLVADSEDESLKVSNPTKPAPFRNRLKSGISLAPSNTNKPRVERENEDDSVLTGTLEKGVSKSPPPGGDPKASEPSHASQSSGKVSNQCGKPPSGANRKTPKKSVGSEAFAQSDKSAEVSSNPGDDKKHTNSVADYNDELLKVSSSKQILTEHKNGGPGADPSETQKALVGSFSLQNLDLDEPDFSALESPTPPPLTPPSSTLLMPRRFATTRTSSFSLNAKKPGGSDHRTRVASQRAGNQSRGLQDKNRLSAIYGRPVFQAPGNGPKRERTFLSDYGNRGYPPKIKPQQVHFPDLPQARDGKTRNFASKDSKQDKNGNKLTNNTNLLKRTQ